MTPPFRSNLKTIDREIKKRPDKRTSKLLNNRVNFNNIRCYFSERVFSLNVHVP